MAASCQGTVPECPPDLGCRKMYILLQESSLRKLFAETYPRNVDMDDVLIKVCSLNDFLQHEHFFIIHRCQAHS